jgi:hypothetical protein
MDKLTPESKYKKIKKEFQESLSAMSELHTEMREYDEFYNAKQWSKERASWRPDPVVNYVAYIVDQKAPMITNQRPSGMVLPTSSDDEAAAHLFTQVTDVIAERLDLDNKIDEIVRTGLLLGTGFFYVYWDNSLKGGKPQFDPMGNIIGGNQWVGDVAIDVVDPSNVYPDPNATCMEDCRYIIYAVPKSLQWIKKTFNQDVDADSSFQTEIYNRPTNQGVKDRTMFYAYWYKDGDTINVCYAAGGQILKEIPEVYKHGRYPFVPFIAKKNRKSLWGIGEPKNIINNQKLLNKLVEIPTTNAMLTANPIALVNSRSGVDPKKWVNKAGQVWQVNTNPNEAVAWLQPPRASVDIPMLMDKMVTFIERMGGVYDAVTGETPSGVTAASAISMLQEQGSIPIKGITRNLYQTLKDVYELMIELVKEFYQETRYLRIVGEDGSIQFQEFQGAQYAEIDFDVKVSGGASTPTSKAYIAQLSHDLFSQGLLLPSEYVEMQENLPNKDRIVSRLKEQEQQPKQQGPEHPPNISISYRDLPPDGQVQAAQLAGLQIQTPMPMMQPGQPQQPQQAPDAQSILQQAPPELQPHIQAMLHQGMSPDQVLQILMKPQGR